MSQDFIFIQCFDPVRPKRCMKIKFYEILAHRGPPFEFMHQLRTSVGGSTISAHHAVLVLAPRDLSLEDCSLHVVIRVTSIASR